LNEVEVGFSLELCRAYRLPNHQVGEPAHEHLGWQVASMLTTERTLGSDRLGWHRLYGCRHVLSTALALDHDYRAILLGLQGVTGKKAVDSNAMTVKN
jgi:hypothetical protein